MARASESDSFTTAHTFRELHRLYHGPSGLEILGLRDCHPSDLRETKAPGTERAMLGPLPGSSGDPGRLDIEIVDPLNRRGSDRGGRGPNVASAH